MKEPDRATQQQCKACVFLGKFTDPITLAASISAFAALITAAIYAAQLRVMRHQADLMRDSVRANRKTIDKMDEISVGQTEETRRIITEQAKAAAAMEVAARAAANSAALSADTLATNREIERAYIAMAHHKVSIECAQDSHGGQDPARPRALHVEIHIKNHGRTPGDLIGGYVGYHIGDKPTLPAITQAINPITAAFLLPDKVIDFGFSVEEAHHPQLVDALLGNRGLWLIAEIDYIDRFGQLHTGGYGRRLAGSVNRPTLVFAGETAPFNYDRAMHPDKQKHYGKG